MSKFVRIYLEIERTFASCIDHFFRRLFCVLMLKNAYFCGTGNTCITVMICLICRLHRARMIWIAILIAIWVVIWIAIQKMYPFTRYIHCSIQQSASHCYSLSSRCYIAILLISGLKLSRSQSKSSV